MWPWWALDGVGISYAHFDRWASGLPLTPLGLWLLSFGETAGAVSRAEKRMSVLCPWGGLAPREGVWASKGAVLVQEVGSLGPWLCCGPLPHTQLGSSPYLSLHRRPDRGGPKKNTACPMNLPPCLGPRINKT